MELIKITTHSGSPAVSARELYEYLEYNPAQWKRWYSTNIEKDDWFTETEDYWGFDIMLNGNKTREFALTLDTAKELCMLARNAKGKQAREYFIEIEKNATQQLPANQDEIILMLAQRNVEANKRIDAVEDRIKLIEAKGTTSDVHYFAIMGYANLSNRKVDLKEAAALGRKAAKMCTAMGFITGTAPDARFGKVKTYPKEVLEEVFR